MVPGIGELSFDIRDWYYTHTIYEQYQDPEYVGWGRKCIDKLSGKVQLVDNVVDKHKG